MADANIDPSLVDPALTYPTLSSYDQKPSTPTLEGAGYAVTPGDGGSQAGDHGFAGNLGNGRKRARSDNEDEEGKVKKTRQSHGRDQSLVMHVVQESRTPPDNGQGLQTDPPGRVKCDRPPPGTASPGLARKDVCSHCQQLGLACTFEYKPKKRGPPNLYLRRLQEGGSPSLDRSPSQQPPHAMLPPTTPRVYPSNPARQEVSEPYIASSGYYRSGLSTDQGGPGPGTLAEQSAIRATSLSQQGQGMQGMAGRDVDAEWEPSMLMTLNATRSDPPQPSSYHSLSPHVLSTSPLQRSHTSHPSHSPTYSTPPYPAYPHNANNTFDAILPRGLLHRIIDLYFDYVYCLIPCLHRSTFLNDLHSRREEQDGEDEWTALVFSVLAVTLVQLPRAFVPMPRKDVKTLVEKCHGLGRDYLGRDFKEATVIRCIIVYLNAFTAVLTGRPLVADALFATNWICMLRLRLHEEPSYTSLNPVDRQLRRRIFWLQYGADRSLAAIDGVPTLMSEDDCAGVALPSEVDDEYITEEGYLDQPEGRTPILSGFYYISKLFRISGQILEKRRRDKRKPPSGLMLQMRVNEVNELHTQVMALMDDCPPALRIDTEHDNKSIGSFSDDWDMHASNDIRQLFLDPLASHAVVKDAYLVQQANIYVTQQMIRYIVLQYRDELLSIQREELTTQTRNGDTWTRPVRQQSSTRRQEWRNMFSDEEKDEVASDLLNILQKIPIQVIAVNSMPLVIKIRFVASTLLDALTPSPSGDNSIPGSQRTQKAQTYLWDFLRILSEIEALYSMTDDEPST